MSTSYQQLVEELAALSSDEHKFTDWEVDFIDSVEKQIRAGNTLSPKQESIIAKLHCDVFIRGRRTRKDKSS